ncbi:hypothetical protein HX92_2518 [Mycobacterium tuberculosis]|nr:hypothetical protein BCGT_0265 [Mycobacterium tuberculosis variant bovis BCG str. ATCC 35743]AKR00067.1 hypothetical protein Mb1595_p0544 [Mycobacterium tuberculosis variant bovis]ALA76857.1 Uncharacterized protein BCGR_0539 [Mycobacterium tuberculosis variant bovis BCG]AOZ41542.1 hypothetical protein BTB1458_0532 [Mycobacterium tuberculosis]EQM21921.1 hypothetical protein GuangZ0019_1280 [Mycobacterium tuberculosis GuangZ0019]EQM24232.1 hypothetical protein FJ05194_0613 [Mycobacterium tube
MPEFSSVRCAARSYRRGGRHRNGRFTKADTWAAYEVVK